VPTHRERGRSTRAVRLVTVAAVALAVSGVAAVAVGIGKQDPAPPAPPAAAGPTQQATSSDPATPDGAETPEPADGADRGDADETPTTPSGPPALDYSAPVHVSIPRIDASSRLVELGLAPDGTMETPQPPHVDQAGWFTPSPPPGIPGATVIAGHVTWNAEPEVFFRLGDLRTGDRVRVRRADGVTTVFEVYRIGRFPKDGFPTDAVYDQPDRSELRLITCGGEYDAAEHRYLANVIIWARMVDVQNA
jgi:LPXTG-site transpeptidase (sortase) family protein